MKNLLRGLSGCPRAHSSHRYAKAFDVTDIPQLTQQIARPLGILWLLAAALFLSAAMLLFTWPQRWWVVGAGAVIVSQIVILTSWSDARMGRSRILSRSWASPSASCRKLPRAFARMRSRDCAQGLGRAVRTPLLTEADLAQLPTPVQRYIRLNGAVGQPRVQNFRARFHGQIRSGPSARWMSFTGEQHNFCDQPSRLFPHGRLDVRRPIPGVPSVRRTVRERCG